MQPPQSPSRRRFLQQGLALAAPLPKPALTQLRTQIKGTLTLPADSAYDTARRVYFWNPTNERRPELVLQPANADDLRHAVDFARAHSLEISIRGGGHSAMGWGASNGLMLDMSALNRVTIDPARRIARTEGGASSADVMRAAGQHGLAPILGQCPGVGATGVTLGGGLGWLSGLHGASCDNLLSLRLVTANGCILDVDAARDAELLWGLRGAGANFGITASFECRLHPIGNVTSGDIFYDSRHARTVLRSFREFMSEAPDTFQATMNLTRNERGVYISLCHAVPGAQGAAEAARLLKSLRSIAPPMKDTVQLQPFSNLSGRTNAGIAGVNFRSLTTTYQPALTDDFIARLLDRLAQAPPEGIIGVSHYMHGEVCRAKPTATAFPLRQAGAVHIRAGVDWNDPAASQRLMAWPIESRRLLRASSGERIYANYQSYAGPGAEQSVYGENLPRLKALKAKHDPTNLFRRNSNIAPA